MEETILGKRLGGKTKKFLLWAIPLASLVLIVGVFGSPWVERWEDRRVPGATIDEINAQEEKWYMAEVTDYTLIVDLDLAGEGRRHTVTVRAGLLAEAHVQYWGAQARGWGPPVALPAEEAYYMTVPGLFETVRGALLNSGRDEVRADFEGEPPFPRLIILGPVRQDGELVEGTEARLNVQSFEILAGR